MKIPIFILTIFLTASLMLEGWTLNEIVNLKVEIAAIKVQLQINNPTIAQNHEH